MKESGYYPIGTEYASNAPWNEPTTKKSEFRVGCLFAIYKSMNIVTDDYIQRDDDTFFEECKDTDYTDWRNAYQRNGHFSLLDMLAELSNYVDKELKDCDKDSRRYKQLRQLHEDCNNWVLVEETYERLKKNE